MQRNYIYIYALYLYFLSFSLSEDFFEEKIKIRFFIVTFFLHCHKLINIVTKASYILFINITAYAINITNFLCAPAIW